MSDTIGMCANKILYDMEIHEKSIHPMAILYTPIVK